MSFEFDPIYMISGKEVFLRERYKREFLLAYSSSGGAIEEVNGDQFALRLSSRAFFKEDCLFLLPKVDEKCYELLLKHEETPFEGVVVLIVSEETIKKKSPLGDLSVKIGPKRHIQFEPIAPYLQEKAAQKFLIKELRKEGLSLSLTTATKVVSEVGSDLGFLANEAWKMARLAKSLGVTEIEEDLCKRTVVKALESSLFPLVEAIGMKQPSLVVKQLKAIEDTHSDPTMPVCRLVASSALKWLATRDLMERESLERSGSEILSVSPGHYQQLVKISSRWRVEDLFKLIDLCSKTENAVFGGAPNPWVYFCSRTYNLLSSLRTA